jgi:hypothetical protein
MLASVLRHPQFVSPTEGKPRNHYMYMHWTNNVLPSLVLTYLLGRYNISSFHRLRSCTDVLIISSPGQSVLHQSPDLVCALFAQTALVSDRLRQALRRRGTHKVGTSTRDCSGASCTGGSRSREIQSDMRPGNALRSSRRKRPSCTLVALRDGPRLHVTDIHAGCATRATEKERSGWRPGWY